MILHYSLISNESSTSLPDSDESSEAIKIFFANFTCYNLNFIISFNWVMFIHMCLRNY